MAIFIPRHMKKQGEIFYYRRRVPADLQQVFGLTEWTKTLKTSTPSEARQAKSALDVEVNRILLALRIKAIDVSIAQSLIDALLFAKNGAVDTFLREWLIRQEELNNGEITRDEYFEWKLNWPHTCDDEDRHEPRVKWRAEQ